MKSIIRKITLAVATLLLGSFFFTASPVFATGETESSSNGYFNVCEKLDPNSAAYKANGCDGNARDSFTVFIINIINVIMGIIAIVAVVAIIIGGIQYMTSTGEPGKVKKARDTILYSVIGLVVVSLAAAIVNFVIKATTESASPASSASSYVKESNRVAIGYKDQRNKESTE